MSLSYYRALMNLNGLNANYLIYKSRVESDGGAIVDEVGTNAKFDFLDNNSLRTDLKFAISKDAGNKITSSAIEDAYTLYQGVSGADLDFEQPTSADRPTSSYDFDGSSDHLETITKSATTNNQTTWSLFFKTGTVGTITGGLRRLVISGTGSTQRTGVYLNSTGRISVTIIQGGSFQDIIFTTTLASNKSYMIVYNGSDLDLELFVDGVSTETIATVRTESTFAQGYTVGSFMTGSFQFFDGEMTDVYLFNSDQSSNASIIHSNL